MKILIINGPNLNTLGKREPKIYGHETLKDIENKCMLDAKSYKNMQLTFKQSNHEGEIVTWIQDASTTYDGIILNAGAYTHTSVAILDAIKATGILTVEVHLSNIFQREEFRHHSYISLAATGIISGFGSTGYLMALKYFATNENK